MNGIADEGAAMTTKVPAAFWDDHVSRLPIDDGESMAFEVSRAGSRVTIQGTAAQIEVLRRDAEYYADADSMDECPRFVRESARRTLSALAKHAQRST